MLPDNMCVQRGAYVTKETQLTIREPVLHDSCFCPHTALDLR